MADKKKHHYIPQYYLKGFTSSVTSHQLFVYQKGKTDIFKANISDVGHQNHFYTYTEWDGEKDSSIHENYLADKIENPANKVLKKIREMISISEEEKWIFSVYLAVMIKRVPKHRERVKDLNEKTLQDFANEISEGKYKQVLTTEAHQDLALKILEVFGSTMLQNALLPEFSEIISKAIFSLKWQFLVCQGEPGFICSDNPLVFDEGPGLKAANQEITFPITSTIALWMHRKEGEEREYFFVEPDVVAQVNQRTLIMAGKYIYYPTNEQWIKDLVNS